MEPVHHLCSRHLEVGERLDLTIHPPGGRADMKFKPWVTAVEPHRYLEWLGHLGMPGIFDGRHSFTLTPMCGGRTLIQQSETFTGVLIPFTEPCSRARVWGSTR